MNPREHKIRHNLRLWKPNKYYNEYGFVGKIRWWKTQFYLSWVMIITITLIAFLIVVHLVNVANSPRPVFQDSSLLDRITFVGNITDDEKFDLYYHGLDDLKTEYSIVIKNITFTDDYSFLTKKCGSDSVGGKSLGGCNKPFSGKLYIFVQHPITNERVVWLRTAICHEILHSVIKGSENDHRIIYDLGYEQVCYQHPQRTHYSDYYEGFYQT